MGLVMSRNCPDAPMAPARHWSAGPAPPTIEIDFEPTEGATEIVDLIHSRLDSGALSASPDVSAVVEYRLLQIRHPGDGGRLIRTCHAHRLGGRVLGFFRRGAA